MLNLVYYCDILKDHVVNENLPPDLIFLHDNALVHKSHSTMEFLQANNVSVLEWPPQSPDLNSIKNLLHYISRDICKLKMKSVDHLFDLVLQSWNSILISIIHNLIDSMPRRCRSVINNFR